MQQERVELAFSLLLLVTSRALWLYRRYFLGEFAFYADDGGFL